MLEGVLRGVGVRVVRDCRVSLVMSAVIKVVLEVVVEQMTLML